MAVEDLLFLTTRIPFPPLKGDQAITFNRVKDLKGKVRCHLLAIHTGKVTPEQREQLSTMFHTVTLIPASRFKMVANLVSGVFRLGVPFQVLLYSDSRVVRALKRLHAEIPGLLVDEILIRNHENLKRAGTARYLVELIDSMILNFRRRASEETGIRKLLFQEELRRLRRYEASLVEKAPLSLVVSNVDRQELGSPESLQVLPIGIRTTKASSPKTHDVVFSGNMGYFPNIHALDWFLDNCFVPLKAARPSVTMAVIGKGLSESRRERLRDLGIDYKGFVPDMLVELAAARVSIAPMRAGSGMQFKILESMSVGTPVICSSIGNQPIGAIDGSQIIVEDRESEFVEKCLELLDNPERRESLGREAKCFVDEHFSWESINERYLKMLETTFSTKGESL